MKIIAIFLLIVLIIALIMFGTVMSRRDWRGFDAQYYDEEGDHVYYDRSLMEKKEYLRRHPREARRLRTFRHLFHRWPPGPLKPLPGPPRRGRGE